jgi:hypothetical protein
MFLIFKVFHLKKIDFRRNFPEKGGKTTKNHLKLNAVEDGCRIDIDSVFYGKTVLPDLPKAG